MTMNLMDASLAMRWRGLAASGGMHGSFLATYAYGGAAHRDRLVT